MKIGFLQIEARVAAIGLPIPELLRLSFFHGRAALIFVPPTRVRRGFGAFFACRAAMAERLR